MTILKSRWNAAFLVAVALACTASSSTPAAATTTPASAAPELRTAMRKLWADHVIWTRQYIVSAALGDQSAQAASQRLLKNQEDIGNAVAQYYGQPAGAKLTELLKAHILIAVDLVTAAKAGDAAKQADADKRWHDNAAEIATFLSGANPNWSKQELEAMLQKHLDLTTGEVVGRLTKDWTADIHAYDEGHAHMLMFADKLTAGIAKQFPAKAGK